MFLMETGESGTIPYTISEKSGFSYGLGWGGVVGGLKIIQYEKNICGVMNTKVA